MVEGKRISMIPVAILRAGMVTGVGLNAAASCAAIRCAIDNFSENRFMDNGGELIDSQVPLGQRSQGLSKRAHMRAITKPDGNCRPMAFSSIGRGWRPRAQDVEEASDLETDEESA